jgi:DNA-binding GntR family transcriptional regulator
MVLALNGNQELIRTFPLARSDLVRSQIVRFLSGAQWGWLTRNLQDVADAIIDGNPRQAERAMRAHFLVVREAVARLPADAPC